MADLTNEMKIKILWDDLQAQQGIERTRKGVQAIGKETEFTRRNFSQLASVGVSGLNALGAGAGSMNAQLSQSVSVASQLAQGALFGGAAGIAVTAVSLGISALINEMNKANVEAEKLRKPFEDVRKEIAALIELKGFSGYAKEIGISEDALKKYLGTSKQANDVGQTYTRLQQSIAENEKEITDARQRLNLVTETWQQEGRGGAEEVARATESYRAEVARLENKSNTLKTAQSQLGGVIKQNAESFNTAAKSTANISSAADAIRGYNKQLGAMATAHAKSQRGFADDWTKAETKAARDVEKIRANSIERISDLERSAAERLFEMARAQAKADTEFQRDREQSEAEYIKARGGLELDAANEIEKINSDLRDSLEQLNRDSLEDEIGASSWAEVQKIRRNAQRRRDELNQKANENKTEAQNKLTVAQQELAARKRERDDEANYNKQKRDEEYNYDRNKANQELNEAREKARQEAQAAIEERNRQLGEERVAIQARRDEETAAYNQNRNDARIAHNERITQLFDTRTDVQKLASDWLLVKSNIDAATAAQIQYSGAMTMTPTQQNLQSGYRPKGWYAEGGDFVVNRPTVIGVGERGAERVTVTPLTGNNRGNAGGRGDVVINIGGNVYGVNDLRATIWRALDQYDKGLM